MNNRFEISNNQGHFKNGLPSITNIPSIKIENNDRISSTTFLNIESLVATAQRSRGPEDNSMTILAEESILAMQQKHQEYQMKLKTN